MTGVYGWMAAGLAVTAVAAMAVASSESAVRLVFGTRFLFYGLLLGEIGLVIYLGARIMTMSAEAAKAGFLAYSALNGVTLSAIFFAYTADSIASTFFVTAGMFGATSAYGHATKRDLTAFGSFLFMGLVGILIASVVMAVIFMGLLSSITGSFLATNMANATTESQATARRLLEEASGMQYAEILALDGSALVTENGYAARYQAYETSRNLLLLEVE